MRCRALIAILGLAMLLTMTAGAVAAEKGFIWNGAHWAKSSMDGKLGYIWGLSNLADEETAGAAKVGKTACVAKSIQDAMNKKAAVQIVEDLDKFYKDNPAKLDTPVIAALLRTIGLICPVEPPAGEKKK